MLKHILVAVGIAAALQIGFAVLAAQKPEWFGKWAHQTPLYTTETLKNPPQVPPLTVPAPAPEVKITPPVEPPRVVSPSGPNPPNAQVEAKRGPTRSPEAQPLDPQEATHTEVPFDDNLRHPELSFGPGVPNTDSHLVMESGVAGNTAEAAVSQFSPEFAQNGGQFMGSVFANDLSQGGEYASI